MTSYLDNQFASSELLPLSLLEQLGRLSLAEVNRLQLIRGHFDLTPQYILRKKIDCIAWLRNPVSRSLSEYLFLRNTPTESEAVNVPGIAAAKRTGLAAYLARPGGAHESYDVQCRALSSASIDPADALIDPADRLRLAQSTLRSLPFFGLTERMQESLDWLAWLLGGRPLDEPPRLNGARQTGQLETLDPAEREALEAANRNDLVLVRDGRALFGKRWQQTLTQIVGQIPADNLLAEGRLHMALEGYLAGWIGYSQLRPHLLPLLRRRFETLRSSQPATDTVEYSFDSPLDGEGWHEREPSVNLMQRTLRWTGPSRDAKICLKLRKGRSYRVRLRCWIYLTQALAEGVRISLNGVPATSARIVLAGSEGRPHVVHEAVFPEAATSQREEFSTVTIHVPDARRPCDIYPGQADSRQLGVGIDWISVEAQSVRKLSHTYVSPMAGKTLRSGERRNGEGSREIEGCGSRATEPG